MGRQNPKNPASLNDQISQEGRELMFENQLEPLRDFFITDKVNIWWGIIFTPARYNCLFPSLEKKLSFLLYVAILQCIFDTTF